MLLSRYHLYKADIKGASAGAAFGGWQKELALSELNKSLLKKHSISIGKALKNNVM